MWRDQYSFTTMPREKSARANHRLRSTMSGMELWIQVLLLTACCWVKVHSLQIKEVQVPSEAWLGKDVTLRCIYDLEGTALYSLKWYKGRHEFYRYVPKESPPARRFPWADNIHIHEDPHEIGKVRISSVPLEAEGLYRCEVINEVEFFTEFGESTMTILQVQDEQPLINGSMAAGNVYRPGDVLRLNCSLRSRPSAKLAWNLNGKEVAPEAVIRFAPQLVSRGFWLTRIGLDITLQARHFLPDDSGTYYSSYHGGVGPRLKVSCLARVGNGDLYRSESSLSLEGLPTALPVGRSQEHIASSTAIRCQREWLIYVFSLCIFMKLL